MRIRAILLTILSLLILCIFGPFLTLWLIEVLKLEGALGWHLAALLAFFALALFYVLARRVPPPRLVNPLAFSFLLFILIIETPILLFAPANSFVPAGVLELSGWMWDARKGPCNFQSLIANADDFYQGAIDFSRVRIVHGGLPRYPRFRRATVIEETIYVRSCLELETFIHETAHIWQHQNGLWRLGPRAALEGVRRLYRAITDPSGNDLYEWRFIYNYGGSFGLAEARGEGKSFIEFGEEQQAMIMQDYFRAITGYSADTYRRLFTPGYIEDLEFFAQQVVGER